MLKAQIILGILFISILCMMSAGPVNNIVNAKSGSDGGGSDGGGSDGGGSDGGGSDDGSDNGKDDNNDNGNDDGNDNGRTTTMTRRQ